MFEVGQGLLGKIRFVDGKFPEYDRPYLIVSVSTEKIGVLNISSVEGKAHKISYGTNKEIKNYKPPFKLPSMAKLDSLVMLDVTDACCMRLLHNGDRLDATELQIILNCLGNAEQAVS